MSLCQRWADSEALFLYCVPSMALIFLVKVQLRVFTAKLEPMYRKRMDRKSRKKLVLVILNIIETTHKLQTKMIK